MVGRLAEGVGRGGDAAQGVVGRARDVRGHRAGERLWGARDGPVGAEGVHRGRLAAQRVVEEPGREARVAGGRAAGIGGELQVAGGVVAVVRGGAAEAGVGGERADRAAEAVVDRVGPPAG